MTAVPDDERFVRARTRFFAVHGEDPRAVDAGDGAQTASTHYHARLGQWVQRLDPTAPEVVRLAAACQHIRRWAVPRADFPDGPAGYKRWRSTLALRHADEAEEILTSVGYDPATIGRVRDLLLKKRLRADPEVQLLEDAVCLVFLELDFVAFAGRHGEEKTIDVLGKTWDKMSERGRTAALELVGSLPEDLAQWVRRAVTRS